MTNRVSFSDISDWREREKWALTHCSTFLYRTITDVSDVSNTTDTIYEFYLADEKDAMWFRLHWQ